MLPRSLVLIALVILVVATFYVGGLPSRDRQSVYDTVGVIALDPPFFDMNYILASLDCARAGIAPTEYCAAAGHTFIYPKTFYLLLPSGLSVRHILWAAALIFAAFTLSMFAFFKCLGWKQSLYVLLLLGAPPTILAMERCNVDLLVISLLASAIICLEARRWPALALSAITVAALIKVYPVAAFAGALGRVRRVYFVAASLVCALGLGVQLDHLRYISGAVPRIIGFSWGYPVAFMALRRAFQGRNLQDFLPPIMDHSLQVLAPVLCVFLAVRIARRECPPLYMLRCVSGLVIGSSVYCFCWMSGPNFDYRYLFLLLTLPCLFDADRVEPLRPLRMLSLAAIAPMFWLSLSYRHTVVTVIQEVLGLIVFCSLLTLLLVFLLQEARQSQVPFARSLSALLGLAQPTPVPSPVQSTT